MFIWRKINLLAFLAIKGNNLLSTNLFLYCTVIINDRYSTFAKLIGHVRTINWTPRDQKTVHLSNFPSSMTINSKKKKKHNTDFIELSTIWEPYLISLLNSRSSPLSFKFITKNLSTWLEFDVLHHIFLWNEILPFPIEKRKKTL